MDHADSKFCSRRSRGNEIKRFSEPGTMGPYTMSEVAYVYSSRDVPDWANDTRVREAMPALVESLKAKQVGKAMLIKTNEGWVHERDFSE